MRIYRPIPAFVLMMAIFGASGRADVIQISDEFLTIQQVIDDPSAVADDDIVALPGNDNKVINFSSKAITPRIIDPSSSQVAVVVVPPEDIPLPMQPPSEAGPVPISTEVTPAERLSSPSAATQVGGGDADTCGATTPHLVGVGQSVTILGDSTLTTGPDLCLSSNPIFGNIWWVSFVITECAAVTIDLCGTTPPTTSSWQRLTQCDGGNGCSDFVIRDFFDTSTCGDGNYTMAFLQLPPGTYYVPLTIGPDQAGLFQLNISAAEIPCPGACCTPAAGTCVEVDESVECSLAGQEFTYFVQCCDVECRDPAGPEYDSSGVTLLSRVSLEDFADFAGTPGDPYEGNEVWGYTSPAGREYAIMGFNTGTGYVDVTDPANPVILEFINVGVVSETRDMAIFDEYAYVAAGPDEAGGADLELMIIDLTDIDNGNVTWKTTQLDEGFLYAHNIYINADSATLYLMFPNLNSGLGLTAFSLIDPLNPTLSGNWTDDDEQFDVLCHDVQVINYTDGPNAGKEIAFCFAASHGLKIVDVTDKAAMVTLSTMTYPNKSFCHQGWVSEDGQYVIFGDELDEYNDLVPQMRTFVADVSDLSAPTLAFTYESEACNIDHNLMVRGNRVYEANYST